ncbi:MAG: PIN domain-containing protein [bacterium]
MNLIVDTSVWSLALRRDPPANHPKVALLEELIKNGESIYLLGVIVQEILQGIRKTSNFKKVMEHLSAFPVIHLRLDDHVEAAKLWNHCASKGVLAGTIDFLIAAVAIRSHCRLLTTDEDFSRIARHSKLRVL